MSGTKTGGIAAAATNKIKYGEGFYRNIGKLGGMVKNPNKGFGGNRELASIAGVLGDRKSRRTKKAAL